MCWVNDSNYTNQCNELKTLIILSDALVSDSNFNDWCIELMILIVAILTQLVNCALVLHNTDQVTG